ncbi:MAG: 2-C-methyl-D-erythritol 2,4-cyclodiphosphate synthase, partial [Acidimicrobiia bacterium]|nr:2-C-methyl-D-erythritol 2,4-cyclodiphosphate synthase [Acidimicrobiia bacterium]
MRVGIGYDSHRFSEDGSLLLGGVEIPDSPGLSGHSDGDAVLHALIDALLGAAALGNIGEHYPDTDPAYAGVDSATLVADTAGRLGRAGFKIGNIDITVIAERPKIQPHVPAMIERISSIL